MGVAPETCFLKAASQVFDHSCKHKKNTKLYENSMSNSKPGTPLDYKKKCQPNIIQGGTAGLSLALYVTTQISVRPWKTDIVPAEDKD